MKSILAKIAKFAVKFAPAIIEAILSAKAEDDAKKAE